MTLRTARLDLVAMTHELAQAEAAPGGRLGELLSARIPSDWPPPLNDDDSARFFRDALAAEPGAAGWYAWYFLLREGAARTAVGNGGFKGPPAAGTVEIGYSVIPAYQRCGYGTEAVDALVGWALAQPGAERVVAETFPELVASQAVLRRLGFVAARDPAVESGALRFERRSSCAGRESNPHRSA